MLVSKREFSYLGSILFFAVLAGCNTNTIIDEPTDPSQLTISTTTREKVDEADVFFIHLDTEDWHAYQSRYNAVVAEFPDHKYLYLFKSKLLDLMIHYSDFLQADDVSCKDLVQFARVYDELEHAYPEENFKLLERLEGNCVNLYRSEISSMAVRAFEKGVNDHTWRKSIADQLKGTTASTREHFVLDYESYMPKLKAMAMSADR